MIEIVDAYEAWEKCIAWIPSRIFRCCSSIIWYEGVLDLTDNARHRAASPSKVIGLYQAAIVFCGHVHDEVWPVRSSISFVRTRVAKSIAWTWGYAVDVEAGSSVGSATGSA